MRIHLGHGFTPAIRETQNHVINVFVEGVVHVVVKEFLRDKLEHFLVVLPVLHFSLLETIFSNIRLILN